MKDFKQEIWNLARIKFGDISEEVGQRLIAETDAIKEYGRGEMLHTMWRLVDELRKHDINIRLALGQGPRPGARSSPWGKVIMCH